MKQVFQYASVFNYTALKEILRVCGGGEYTLLYEQHAEQNIQLPHTNEV